MRGWVAIKVRRIVCHRTVEQVRCVLSSSSPTHHHRRRSPSRSRKRLFDLKRFESKPPSLLPSIEANRTPPKYSSTDTGSRRLGLARKPYLNLLRASTSNKPEYGQVGSQEKTTDPINIITLHRGPTPQFEDMSSSPKSLLRNANGPRAVDAGQDREIGRTSSRHHRESDGHGGERSKRDAPTRRSSEKKSAHRRRQSVSQAIDVCIEQPSFELDVIAQPERGVVLGMLVHTSIMISLRLPAPDRSANAGIIDTSGLFAVVSLLAENRSGERVPLENGVMTSQKMFDSVHAIPDEYAERFTSNQPCRLALGYFSFPDLLIRQVGTYRIRVTLVKIDAAGGDGGSSVLSVDSDVVKVDRRSGAATRRQRVNI